MSRFSSTGIFHGLWTALSRSARNNSEEGTRDVTVRRVSDVETSRLVQDPGNSDSLRHLEEGNTPRRSADISTSQDNVHRSDPNVTQQHQTAHLNRYYRQGTRSHRHSLPPISTAVNQASTTGIRSSWSLGSVGDALASQDYAASPASMTSSNTLPQSNSQPVRSTPLPHNSPTFVGGFVIPPQDHCSSTVSPLPHGAVASQSSVPPPIAISSPSLQHHGSPGIELMVQDYRYMYPIGSGTFSPPTIGSPTSQLYPPQQQHEMHALQDAANGQVWMPHQDATQQPRMSSEELNASQAERSLSTSATEQSSTAWPSVAGPRIDRLAESITGLIGWWRASSQPPPITHPEATSPTSEPTTRYSGRAPLHQPRRYKTRKYVSLISGNLVLNCPVPRQLLHSISRRKEDEFRYMRYTAATCDPDGFVEGGYTLRQRIYGRNTELFIVVTVYNEDDLLLTRTLHGLMKNIAHLCTRNKSKTWGSDGWKKCVVCIVADGRSKVSERVLGVLAALGVYQDGIAKGSVDGKKVEAHIYEYTTQISLDSDLKCKGADKGIVPTQILFCLKENNAKKINSHRWFFNAFAPILDPNVCVLLDVGTRPGNTSIYHLWKAFDLSSEVGGACGEVCAMTGTAWLQLLNPLVAAQNFEYKMSNILDKPFESLFGYISVLPGAFSAYRYIAIKNDETGRGPLSQYFQGEPEYRLRSAHKTSGIFSANMYLAEDRILCFELVSKKCERWILKYVKQAFGETDVPDALPEFLSQRRRWLNGSFFAAVYALFHWHHVWQSGHSIGRKWTLQMLGLHNFVNLLLSWFGMANFYIAFFFITRSVGDPQIDPFGDGWGEKIFEGVRYLYYFLIIAMFICSLGNRPQGSKWMFTLCVVFFGLVMCYMLFCSAWLTFSGVHRAMSDPSWNPAASNSNAQLLLATPGFRDIIISLAATYGLYFCSSILWLDPWHMFTSFLQYLLLAPSYINVLNIYAFCNTHDVSWGTKGDNDPSIDLGAAIAAPSQGVDQVEMELPTAELDINEAYNDALLLLKQTRENKKTPRGAKTKQEDYYRSFRTQLVLVWIACNAILIAVVTSQNWDNPFVPHGDPNPYLAFVFWTVAAMASIRFLGSTTSTDLGATSTDTAAAGSTDTSTDTWAATSTDNGASVGAATSMPWDASSTDTWASASATGSMMTAFPTSAWGASGSSSASAMSTGMSSMGMPSSSASASVSGSGAPTPASAASANSVKMGLGIGAAAMAVALFM
ncbi:hypothetical protein BZG36_02133 [Bifiguratus adelaidae]|uniref:chitin synthase n=1 Tax=Bifiguratus adelaidae TaxID=1938954 RepID=A0A261Y3J0_9FUNG|nr:hypothetical protein BZG36_02133 [Bifiguratus adelaidae]